jgi:hypothetical protein
MPNYIWLTRRAAVGCVLALSMRTTAQAQPPRSAASVIDTGATSLSASSVSTPVAVFRRYPPQARGEFETSAAFRERLAASVTNAPFFAVDITNNCKDTELTCFTYDADKEEMTIWTQDSYTYLFATMLSHSEVPTGSYVGSNAFGATKTIRKSNVVEYLIVPSKGGIFDLGPFKLSMPPRTAAQVKPRQRLLLIFSPGQDSTGAVSFTSRDHTEPKIDYPYDEQITYHVLVARAASLWLWDPVSAKVLYKWPVGPTEKERGQ